jgi:NDP-sugar pyrophosphorylase family protein
MDFGKDVIPGLAGHARGCLLDGYILDIGTPENYQRALVEWPIVAGQQSSGGVGVWQAVNGGSK